MSRVNRVMVFMVLGACVCLAPVTSASPFTAASSPTSPARPEAQAAQPAQTYTGKIVNMNGRLVLKSETGSSAYQLDDQTKAGHYKGKDVIVTGSVDATGKTIHVLYIEPGNSSSKKKSRAK